VATGECSHLVPEETFVEGVECGLYAAGPSTAWTELFADVNSDLVEKLCFLFMAQFAYLSEGTFENLSLLEDILQKCG
jgi:hypothetical protein